MCSETCGNGISIRTRSKIQVENDGGSCSGDGRDFQSCIIKECPGKYFISNVEFTLQFVNSMSFLGGLIFTGSRKGRIFQKKI